MDNNIDKEKYISAEFSEPAEDERFEISPLAWSIARRMVDVEGEFSSISRSFFDPGSEGLPPFVTVPAAASIIQISLNRDEVTDLEVGIILANTLAPYLAKHLKDYGPEEVIEKVSQETLDNLFKGEKNLLTVNAYRKFYTHNLEKHIKAAEELAAEKDLQIEGVFNSDEHFYELLRRVYTPAAIHNFIYLQGAEDFFIQFRNIAKATFKSVEGVVDEDEIERQISELYPDRILEQRFGFLRMAHMLVTSEYRERLWGNIKDSDSASLE